MMSLTLSLHRALKTAHYHVRVSNFRARKTQKQQSLLQSSEAGHDHSGFSQKLKQSIEQCISS